MIIQRDAQGVVRVDAGRDALPPGVRLMHLLRRVRDPVGIPTIHPQVYLSHAHLPAHVQVSLSHAVARGWRLVARQCPATDQQIQPLPGHHYSVMTKESCRAAHTSSTRSATALQACVDPSSYISIHLGNGKRGNCARGQHALGNGLARSLAVLQGILRCLFRKGTKKKAHMGSTRSAMAL